MDEVNISGDKKKEQETLSEKQKEAYIKELDEVTKKIHTVRTELFELIKRESELRRLLKVQQSSILNTITAELGEIVADVKSSHVFRLTADGIQQVSDMIDPGIQALQRGVDAVGGAGIARSVVEAVGNTVDKVKSLIPHPATHSKK